MLKMMKIPCTSFSSPSRTLFAVSNLRFLYALKNHLAVYEDWCVWGGEVLAGSESNWAVESLLSRMGGWRRGLEYCEFSLFPISRLFSHFSAFSRVAFFSFASLSL